MQEYFPLTKTNSSKALIMYNKASQRGEQLYLPLTHEAFHALFLTPPKSGDHVFAFYEARQRGFICGVFDSITTRFFLTLIEVEPGYRQGGIGSLLLAGLEQEMQRFAAARQVSFTELEVSYFNPMNITWVLPGTEGHRHPNASGVRLGSDAHLFLKNRGFEDFTIQNSYHLDVTRYVYPKASLARYEEKMNSRGLTVELYDPARHYGMQDLVDDLNNDLWNWQIPAEMNREGGPRPMLIVSDGGKIVGFAGPIVPDAHGRGFFLGIAIHSQYRGYGAATVLFNHLCLEFRRAGAQYMTLFTAEDNPARHIYERAGFKIHASWAGTKKKEN